MHNPKLIIPVVSKAGICIDINSSEVNVSLQGGVKARALVLGAVRLETSSIVDYLIKKPLLEPLDRLLPSTHWILLSLKQAKDL